VSPDYPLPLPAFSYLGPYRYFLTFCTDNRAHLFTDGAVVALVLSQIQRAVSLEGFALLAYCFMPDHSHLLVEGRSAISDARRFIRLAKQFSGYEYSRRHRRHLWQRYGYERVLRSEESTLTVARYIMENPVRAKLVDQVEDYPFLGSDIYTVREILESVTK
jgi:putative transposase